LQKIEDILSQHEGVSEAAVIGAEDEKWGERSLALVALYSNSEGEKYVQEGRSSGRRYTHVSRCLSAPGAWGVVRAAGFHVTRQ